MNIFWQNEQIPSIFKCGMVRAIPKKKKGDFRPITIQSTIARIFSTLINRRLQIHCANQNIPHEIQGGGQSNRGVHEQLMTIRLIAENSEEGMFFVLFDIQKAFDTIWRECLIRKLNFLQVQGKILRIISNMFKNVSQNVIFNNQYSTPTIQTKIRYKEIPYLQLFSVSFYMICVLTYKNYTLDIKLITKMK